MHRIKLSLIILVDLIFLVVGIINIIRLQKCSSIDLEFYESEAGLVADASSSGFPLSEDLLVSEINSIKVKTYSDILFILDRNLPDKKVLIKGYSNGKPKSILIPLNHYFSLRYIILSGTVALFFFVMGLFILIKKPDKKSVVIFHWIMLAFWVALTSGTEQPIVGSDKVLIFMSRILYLSAYIAIPILFISFSILFPIDLKTIKPIIRNLLILPGVLILFFFALHQYYICIYNSIESQSYYILLRSLFYFFIIVWFIIGSAIAIWKYNHICNHEEQKQYRWLLWGFSFSVLPYIVFRALPQALSQNPIIAEETINLFFIFIPISYSIAIFKEHMLDVDLVINRSVVYMVMTGVIIVIYVILISFITNLIGYFTYKSYIIVSVVLTIIVSLLFYPSKVYLQRTVDKVFYRLKYDFEIVYENIKTSINKFFTINAVGENLILMLKVYQQVKGVVLILERLDEYVQSWSEGDLSMRNININNLLLLLKESDKPIVVNKSAESTKIVRFVDQIDDSDTIILLIPIKNEQELIIGAIGFSEKDSGQIYFVEEIIFLQSIADLVSTMSRKIFLQESLISEQLQRQKLIREKKELEALEKLRQDLSSMIVHDLRNPLSNLIVSIDTIKQSIGNKINETENHYLNYAIQSGKQLLEMINGLLDIHKLEEGKLQIEKEDILISEIIENAILQIKMLANEKNVEIIVDIDKSAGIIRMDKQIISRVIVNLLSNAIKFSDYKTKIFINAQLWESNKLRVSVKDQGPGIPSEYIEKVFDKFVQLQSREKRQGYSTGLGLTYCKLAIENHEGNIWCESRIGVGSTFLFEIPIS